MHCSYIEHNRGSESLRILCLRIFAFSKLFPIDQPPPHLSFALWCHFRPLAFGSLLHCFNCGLQSVFISCNYWQLIFHSRLYFLANHWIRRAKCRRGRSKGHWITSPGWRLVDLSQGQFDFSGQRAHSLTQRVARHRNAITQSALVSRFIFPPLIAQQPSPTLHWWRENWWLFWSGWTDFVLLRWKQFDYKAFFLQNSSPIWHLLFFFN